MRYYKNDDFLIIETDDDDAEIQEICTIGLNLLVKLEHTLVSSACACVKKETGFYAIFPKEPEKLTNEIIQFLITKLQADGIYFEKEDVDCSAIQLQQRTSRSEKWRNWNVTFGSFLAANFWSSFRR